ncbi:MAG TPA: alanine racemase [Candidatus Xenobia bacterium]|nr:alanine racemase [Candidatus Xenobia bacterium]
MGQRPCWAEISLNQLKENLNIIRRHVGDRKVLCVVKADAYGHGAVPVARALEEAGADALGVACVAEAVELRRGGIRAPVIVLTGFFPGEEQELLEYGITPGITEIGQLERLEKAAAAAGRPVRCHVKFDTGMGRLGIPCNEVGRLLEVLSQCRAVRVEGLYTHFAAAEDFTSSQTAEQVARFEKLRAQCAAAGLKPAAIHLANTGAIVARPETWGTMVRPGSMLYGYLSFYKFPEGQDRSAELAAQVPVRPVLTLKAQVYSIRELPAGAPLGYGATFVASRPSRIAILPVGYGDGWRRGLSGKARVIVRGRFAPMVGTVGMDLTFADVTDIPGTQPGDEIVLIGINGTQAIPPTELARSLGTVASEVLTGLSKRVPRIYR